MGAQRSAPPRRPRLAVYTDYAYRRAGNRVYADRAFTLFLARLAREPGGMVVVGRLDPRAGRSHYPLAPGVEFVALPHYRALSRPLEATVAMARSLRRFWRVLDDVAGAWLLGPHPLALVFAVLCRARGRAVVLGVRQDTPAYVRSRHPRARGLAAAAIALDAAYRLLARLAHDARLRARLTDAGVGLVRRSNLDGETARLGRFLADVVPAGR